MENLSLPAIATKVPTEAAAYEFLEQLRWGDEPVCPHCCVIGGHYFLKPRAGARKTRTGAATQRRLWKCKDCRKQFSVLVGTIFHRTKVPVRTWLLVIADMMAAKNGISAREVERKYALTPRTAWFVCHRIREAMTTREFATLMSGAVEADEAYIGGNPKNRHRTAEEKAATKSGRGTDKTIVLSLLSRESGEVRSRVIPNVTGATLHAVMEREIDMANAALHTDSFPVYKWVAPEFSDHQAVDHKAGEYVRGDATTNRVEGYFSQLKRSIDGTFHAVSTDHLDRYLAEFDFRYSTRKMTDSQRMATLIERVGGRRLTYRESSSEPSSASLVA
jgi:transposase-like protein